MAFFDKFKKAYTVNCRCFNCGFSQECKIPKGNTIDSWLKTAEALCSNCGNPTLRRIEIVRAPQETREPLKEYPTLPALPPLPRPLQGQQRPTYKPPRPIYRQPRTRPDGSYPMQQEVRNPVIVPVQEEKNIEEPEWNPKPKRVLTGTDFWRGQ